MPTSDCVVSRLGPLQRKMRLSRNTGLARQIQGQVVQDPSHLIGKGIDTHLTLFLLGGFGLQLLWLVQLAGRSWPANSNLQSRGVISEYSRNPRMLEIASSSVLACFTCAVGWGAFRTGYRTSCTVWQVTSAFDVFPSVYAYWQHLFLHFNFSIIPGFAEKVVVAYILSIGKKAKDPSKLAEELVKQVKSRFCFLTWSSLSQGNSFPGPHCLTLVNDNFRVSLKDRRQTHSQESLLPSASLHLSSAHTKQTSGREGR